MINASVGSVEGAGSGRSTGCPNIENPPRLRITVERLSGQQIIGSVVDLLRG